MFDTSQYLVRVEKALTPLLPAPERPTNLTWLRSQGGRRPDHFPLSSSLTLEGKWPDDSKIQWLAAYPLDFDSKDSLEGGRFRRSYLVTLGVVDPPYDPQVESARSPLLTVVDHVQLLTACSRRGSVPLMIILPYRRPLSGSGGRVSNQT